MTTSDSPTRATDREFDRLAQQNTLALDLAMRESPEGEDYLEAVSRIQQARNSLEETVHEPEPDSQDTSTGS